MSEVINLENLFEKYVRNYLQKNKCGLGNDPEELINTLYEKWKAECSEELGGKTPVEFVESIADADDLIKMCFANISKGGEPSPLVSERILKTKEAAVKLEEILEDKDEPEEVRIAASDLLSRMEYAAVEGWLDIIFSDETPNALRDALIEKLKYVKLSKSALLERIGIAAGEYKLILAELLVATNERDERIYELLLELLKEKPTRAYACNLIANYGDERAIMELVDLASDSDYADYIELRSAVERLGGDMPLKFNWDGDLTYKIIKGEKK